MKASSRLTMTGALSHNSTLDSSVSTVTSETSSASVAKAERQIKALKAENSKLRKELQDVRTLYDQLTTENTHEKFDERRIAVLKSLIIQLERQVILMSEALSSRSATLMEVENALTALADKWRHYFGLETKGPEVGVARADLTEMIHTAESARIKLYKNIENTATEKLSRPLIFMNKFLKPGLQEHMTLFDVMTGSLETLNIKEVGKLESKLGNLYKELTCLHQMMEEVSEAQQTDHTTTAGHMTTSGHTCKAVRERFESKLLKACAVTKDCCGDLLTLSVLFPAAPLPCFKKCALKDVDVDRVMRCMPGLPQGKAQEVQNMVGALLKSFNYKHHMMNQQNKYLKEELKFHKTVYNLQISYAEWLLTAMKDGYREFEKSTNEVLLKPLKGILEAYSDMTESGSEKHMKEFMTRFKNTHEHLEDAVEKLSIEEDTDSSGISAMSQFGEEFFCEIDRLVRQCQYRRDKRGRENSELRAVQDQIDQELRDYLEDQEVNFHDQHLTSTENDQLLKAMPTSDRVYQSPSVTPTFDGIKERKPLQRVLNEKEVDTDNITSRTNSKKNQSKTLDNRPPWDNSIDNVTVSEERETVQQDSVAKKRLEDRPPWDSSTDVLDPVVPDVDSAQSESSVDNTADLPPKIKKSERKDRKYVPNTFVPNRTLQLRRTGSLNKLNEEEGNKGPGSGMIRSTSDMFKTTEEGRNSQRSKSRSTSGVRSQSREKKNAKNFNIPTKRPFYS